MLTNKMAAGKFRAVAVDTGQERATRHRSLPKNFNSVLSISTMIVKVRPREGMSRALLAHQPMSCTQHSIMLQTSSRCMLASSLSSERLKLQGSCTLDPVPTTS